MLGQPPRVLRIVAAGLFVLTIGNLFFHGAQAYAINAVPAPWDKLAHFVLHGFLSTMAWLTLGGRREMLALAACAAVAGVDEIGQFWHAGRIADLTDFTASVAGAALALLALRILRHR